MTEHNESKIESSIATSKGKLLRSRRSPVVAARLMVVFCLLGLASIASATPQTYQLIGVTFNDGGTATGYFTFDPSAGTPCSTGASPCGRYFNVTVTTTTGTARTGAIYRYVCGQDVPSCNGVKPDSTEALYLTTTAGDQTGLPALALFFTGVAGVPPAGLGSGGASFDISNSSLAVGAAQEATCSNAACTTPAAPSRSSTAGLVVLIVPMQMTYAANLNLGESYIDITNTGLNGAALNGPGFGAQVGNICANIYAFDTSEELIACCSCLITPNQTVNLGVISNLTSKTLTGVVPTSVTVKLLSTLTTANSCVNSAALAGTTNLVVGGMAAWSTTLHPQGASFATTEKPFVGTTFNNGDVASITGRCSNIIGNASGFGVCNACRSGALGGDKF